MAGLTGKMCKHRGWVGMPVDLDEATKSLKLYKSTLDVFNEIYGGALYNSDEVVVIYGRPQVGKSLFCLQEAVGVGENVLYIDTEGGFKGLAAKWLPVFRARFKKNNKIYLESCRTMESLHEFLGFKTRVVFKRAKEDEDEEEKSATLEDFGMDVDKLLKAKQKEAKKAAKEKGKMEFRILETVDYAPIDAWVEKNNVKFVIVDSVSAPIRLSIPDEQQNFPARATATGIIMRKLIELQKRYEVGVLVTAHASFNPADPTAKLADLRGGIVLHHFAKRMIYIDMREARNMINFRRAWIVRIEDEPRYSRVVGLKITDVGFEEYENVEDLLTMTEKHIVLEIGRGK